MYIDLFIIKQVLKFILFRFRLIKISCIDFFFADQAFMLSLSEKIAQSISSIARNKKIMVAMFIKRINSMAFMKLLKSTLLLSLYSYKLEEVISLE